MQPGASSSGAVRGALRARALESSLPTRNQQVEERQANHIEILNVFSRQTSEQIATLQHRMNLVEQPPSQSPLFGGGAPPARHDASPGHESTIGGGASFAGGASPAPPPSAQRFNIGSPLSDPQMGRPPVPSNYGSHAPPSNLWSGNAHAPPSNIWSGNQRMPNVPSQNFISSSTTTRNTIFNR